MICVFSNTHTHTNDRVQTFEQLVSSLQRFNRCGLLGWGMSLWHWRPWEHTAFPSFQFMYSTSFIWQKMWTLSSLLLLSCLPLTTWLPHQSCCSFLWKQCPSTITSACCSSSYQQKRNEYTDPQHKDNELACRTSHFSSEYFMENKMKKWITSLRIITDFKNIPKPCQASGQLWTQRPLRFKPQVKQMLCWSPLNPSTLDALPPRFLFHVE